MEEPVPHANNNQRGEADFLDFIPIWEEHINWELSDYQVQGKKLRSLAKENK